jgi:hypothetical protein
MRIAPDKIPTMDIFKIKDIIPGQSDLATN